MDVAKADPNIIILGDISIVLPLQFQPAKIVRKGKSYSSTAEMKTRKTTAQNTMKVVMLLEIIVTATMVTMKEQV